MKSSAITSAASALMLVAIALTGTTATAAAEPAAFDKPLELADSERIVLIGDTFFERAQRYGWLESALQLQFPERDIRVRNLGWSGDTVFAESRGIFDSPAKGYTRMLQQVKELRPTTILLNYGGNESFNGPEYVDTFIRQYEKLLDDLSETGARLVLVSPLPLLHTHPPQPDPTHLNAERGHFVRAVARLARRRSLRFVNLWRRLIKLPAEPETHAVISNNGIHLTNVGYSIVAGLLTQDLFGLREPAPLRVDFNAPAADRHDDVEISSNRIAFNLAPGEGSRATSFLVPLRITGLPAGNWTIRLNGEPYRTGIDSRAFHNESLLTRYGIPVLSGHHELRSTVMHKNRMYFHRWRPQNITYLFLFRKHEQGQNAREVDQFEPIIHKLEARIRKLKKQPARTRVEIVRTSAKAADQ